MKKKLLGNIEPKCEYCSFGKLSADKLNVICPKYGVLDKDNKCKKFEYDPLKRQPQQKPQVMQFSEDDFKL